jgi:glycosyltransferase involved in cell wall biosynthesis
MSGVVGVAHIITKLELGGAQQNTLYTVSHLDPARFRPLLISGEPGILDREAENLPGVRFLQVPSLVRSMKPWLDTQALIRLTSVLRHVRPSIVHTHSSKAGILGRWAARLAGVPIIIHSIHGFGFTQYQNAITRRLLISLERSAASVTTQFIAVSEANRKLGIELGLFPAVRCSLIRSGIDLQAWSKVPVDVAAKRRQLGLDPRYPVVGMIAALKPQKAPLDFVRLAAWVNRDQPVTQFVLVGGGELRAAVEAEVSRLGLSGRFVLTGWRRDVQEILRCLDVFVLTSLWEGLPRVYLEALASGVPVVGTRVDGAAEVIADGQTGYLTEPGDVGAMAERVVYLLQHPDEARQLAERGRAIPEEYDIHLMVQQQEAEYDRLMARLPRSRRLSKQETYAAHAKHSP